MAYEKHTWRIGEDFSSWKMNHIEEGIANAGGGGGGLPIVETTMQNMPNFKSTKTYAEIKAMLDAGTPPFAEIKYDSGDDVMTYYFPIIGYSESAGTLAIIIRIYSVMTVAVPSADAYPVFELSM